MGVDGLSNLIKKAPESVRKAEYKEFCGETWAVDASCFLYRFSHNAEAKKNNPCIDGFYQLINRLYHFGIQPIFVFDGSAPVEKAATLLERQGLKQSKLDRIQALEKELSTSVSASSSDMNPQKAILEAQLQSVKSSLIHIDSNIYGELFQLFHYLNTPHYRAIGEADALCVKLCQEGIAQAILSEDGDILLYGAPRLMRKFNWSYTIEEVCLAKLLQGLKLTYTQFIDVCILAGTDYTEAKIQGLAMGYAYQLVSQGQSIEMIIQLIEQAHSESRSDSARAYKKYQLPNDMSSSFNYQAARDLLKNAIVQETQVIAPIIACNYDAINLTVLSQYMIDKCQYQAGTVTKHAKLWTRALPPQPKIKLQLKRKNPILGLCPNI